MIFYQDPTLTLLQGDVRDMLRTLPDESVQCVVTSPPYWGLRDYGVAGQIGLEPSPEAWVAVMVDVFREVRRVLRRDGVVWLNVGDAYADHANSRAGDGNRSFRADRAAVAPAKRGLPAGLKPKDLLMLPARLAQALQRPYYTGRIAREADRAWLAAAIEGEGCIYIQRHPIGTPTGRNRTPRRSDSFGVGLRLATTSRAFVERCAEIAGRGTLRSSSREGQRDYYEWNTWSDDTRELLREIYPYLASKHQEARIAYGAPSGGDLAEASWLALKALHRGSTTEVDFPAPAPLYEPGWYVRSDVIWSKLNPMPESVTDRPTKAHEYVFLLTKAGRYFYDTDAVREEAIHGGRVVSYNGTQKNTDHENRTYPGAKPRDILVSGRNLRDVWTIATEPYPEAHFATFPQKLVEPCIKAGTSERGCCPECGAPWARVVELTVEYKAVKARQREIHGPNYHMTHAGLDAQKGKGSGTNPATLPPMSRTIGWRPTCDHDVEPVPCTVLDPFGGSGTTALVANRLGRRAVLIELNPDYCAQAQKRCRSPWDVSEV